MRVPKRFCLRLLCCAVGVVPLAGCGDASTNGWGTVAIIVDQWLWSSHETPVLEHTATVYGEVLDGHASLSSSDPTVFEVTSMVDDSSATLFTLLAVNPGSADLIVEPEDGTGTNQRLPVQVSEGATVEIRNPSTGEPLDAVAVSREFTFLESVVRDSDGVRLMTHVTWTLEDTDVVVFSHPNHREQFEGALAALVATGEGTTTLRTETEGGLSVTLPVVATVQ